MTTPATLPTPSGMSDQSDSSALTYTTATSLSTASSLQKSPSCPPPQAQVKATVKNLQELKDLLNSLTTPSSVDVCGATLTGPLDNDIVIQQSYVTLRNGSLKLPPGFSLCISGPAKQVVLEGLEVTGTTPGSRGVHDSELSLGLVQVSAGASAYLNHCKVKMVGGTSWMACFSKPATAGSHHAVLVEAGAFAKLDNCFLMGAAGSGLAVHGAAAVLSSCADGNGSHGFTVCGGKLEVGQGCGAKKNLGSGFYATSKGSLVTGAECRAMDNRGSGFSSDAEAKLVVGEKCEAAGNAGFGFSAASGATLVVGAECVARKNVQSGFMARSGGRLDAGMWCKVLSNKQHGFACQDRNSVLTTGAQCVAKGNHHSGFMAERDSQLTTFPGCESTENLQYGFHACSRATLKVGKGCRAAWNKMADNHKQGGGVLDIY